MEFTNYIATYGLTDASCDQPARRAKVDASCDQPARRAKVDASCDQPARRAKVDYATLVAHLQSDAIKIRVKTDTKYPDLFILTHTEETVKEHLLYGITNGLVIERSTMRTLCYSFDKMIDLEEEEHRLAECFSAGTGAFDLQYAMEGTLMRVWWYQGEMMVSTKRCINACLSHWLSRKSFRELFDEALGAEGAAGLATLPQDRAYSLLLTHPENNMVVKYTEPKLYHLGTRNMITLEEEHMEIPGIERVPRMDVTLEQIPQHLHFLKTSPIYTMEGYILMDRAFHRQRFASPTYKKAREIFGNMNSNLMKFFTLRKDVAKLNEYLQMFPQDIEEFNGYEGNFYLCAQQVHSLYIERFIKKRSPEDPRVAIPYYYKKVINDLHTDFKTNRTKTTFEKVLLTMGQQDVKLQCFMYNHYLNPEKYEKKYKEMEEETTSPTISPAPRLTCAEDMVDA